MIQAVDHVALLPLYAAAGTALLVLIVELAIGSRVAVLAAGAAGAVATLAVAAVSWNSYRETFCTGNDCSWVQTQQAAVVAGLIALLTLGVLGLSAPALKAGAAPAGEFCFLLACSMTGGVVVAHAGDLITLIVGLETLTLPLYVLVGLRRTVAGASAALTFLVISVVSTAISLMGAALLYAATGDVYVDGFLQRIDLLSSSPAEAAAPGGTPLATAGLALLVIGFAFKVAAVPLHAWAPATYDGALMPVAAYLSTASKLGGVVALAVVATRLDGPLIAVLAVLTMTVGNLVALRQTRMVRLLAWSSVAQAGYILAALALGWDGLSAALQYATFFVVLEFVAFAAVIALRPPASDGGDLTAYRGAARRSPWIAATFVLAVAGLAGLPPGLAGLFAKITVIDALIVRGWWWLAGVVVVNAVIALAYYVRAAAVLYHRAPGIAVADLRPPKIPLRSSVGVALAVSVLVALVVGFAPQIVFAAL